MAIPNAFARHRKAPRVSNHERAPFADRAMFSLKRRTSSNRMRRCIPTSPGTKRSLSIVRNQHSYGIQRGASR